MVNNRQHGLVVVQAFAVSVILALSYFLAVLLTQMTGFVELVDTAFYDLYLIVIFAAALYFQPAYYDFRQNLGRLSLLDTFDLTRQQLLRLALIVFAVVFAVKDATVSRVFMASYLVFAGGVLFLSNYWLPRLWCRLFFHREIVHAILIGPREAAERMDRWFQEKESLGVRSQAWLARDEDELRDPPQRFHNTARLDQLEALAASGTVGQIILFDNYLTAAETEHVVATCEREGLRLLICSTFENRFRQPMAAYHEDAYTFLTPLDEPLENPLNRFAKRTLDIVVSLPVVLFVLPPLTILVWLMQMRQSPGAVFFVQERTGINRRRFRIYKYRTMHVRPPDPEDTARQATRGDPRIYPFGALLRKTSLDEFPQFFNVLKGDMSIAGPRPHLLAHDDRFAEVMRSYRVRHFVKPGITGLAQARGFRGEIVEDGLLRERVRLDLEYIKRWSLRLDIEIIFDTVRQVFFPPKSAY